jgi:hypothetical protein
MKNMLKVFSQPITQIWEVNSLMGRAEHKDYIKSLLLLSLRMEINFYNPKNKVNRKEANHQEPHD